MFGLEGTMPQMEGEFKQEVGQGGRLGVLVGRTLPVWLLNRVVGWDQVERDGLGPPTMPGSEQGPDAN